MNVLAEIAQVVDSALPGASIIISYGPMGVILCWFMLRGEKLVLEIRSLSHRLDGLTKALLVDMIDRESSGEHVKNYAREAIVQIDERNKPKNNA